jgi:heptosyltransferase-2
VDRSMHVAVACGVPLVAIASPTNHLQTSTVSKHARIVRHRFECSPCMKEECRSDHRCMLSIEPEEVWAEVEGLKRELKIES